MSIFSNWGKGKTTDTDPQDTADKVEQAKQEIEDERQAYLDSLKVDITEQSKVENTSEGANDTPDAPDEPERTVDNELKHEDDDRVR